MASLTGSSPARLAFTSGATEGNNAIFAHFREKLGSQARVAISSVEHPSVLEAPKARFGQGVFELPVDSNGVISLEALGDAFL
mgnify:CR=1 FL=1